MAISQQVTIGFHPPGRRFRSTLSGLLVGVYAFALTAPRARGDILPPIDVPTTLTEELAPPQPGEHPRLIFRKNEVSSLRRKAGTPEGQAILAQLKKTLQGPPSAVTVGYHAAGHCFLHLIAGDKREADIARDFVEKATSDALKHLDEYPLWGGNYKWITRAAPAIGVALAYDLCYDAWDEEFRIRIAAELDSKARAMIKGGGVGWNSSVESNWNAITRGGAGVVAMAVLNDPGSPNAAVSLKEARRFLRKFLLRGIGDRGWCQEGHDYKRFAMTRGLLPFLQAYRNVTGKDLVQYSGADWLLPLFVMEIVPRDHKPYLPSFGTGPPAWERSASRSGDFAMGFGTLPEPYKPAVLWTFDRLFGLDGDKTFDVHNPQDAIFALANYPFDVTPQNPVEILPRVIRDKKGYYVFRKEWKDENDFVGTIYLKSQPAHGWNFPDAGSFRIWGLGGRWANMNLAKKMEREGQNVVAVANSRAWGLAEPTYFSVKPDGSGMLTMNMDHVYSGGTRKAPIDLGIRAVRSFAVDYSGASGAPGMFVVVDRLSGGGEKTWLMHPEGKVTIAGHTFTVTSDSGASLHGTFVAPIAVTLSLGEDNAIKATGGDTYFVVMTVQRGAAPEVRISGTGLDATVRVGDQTISFDSEKIVLAK